MLQPTQQNINYPQSRHPAGLSVRGVGQGPPLSKATSTTARRPLSTPHFRGLLPQRFKNWATNLLLSAFSKVVEVFLWGYITQDVVAMWMPRIRQSLIRGRIIYNPKEDPDNKGLSSWQLLKKSFTKNAKGLNWINFWEETKREIAAGPGTLGIPTLTFALARRAFGHRSVELGYGPLTQLTRSFIQHLNTTPSGVGQAPQVSRAQYKQEVKAFLISRFGFTPEALQSQLKGVSLQVLGKKQSGPLTVKALIHDWANHWVEAVFKQPAQPKTRWEKFKGWVQGIDRDQEKVLDTLNHDLDEGLFKGYNRQYRQLAQPTTLDYIPLRLQAEGKETLTYKAIREFADHDLSRWKDFALKVFEEKAHGGKGGQGFITTLPKLAEGVYQKLITLKAVYSVLATLLTGFYLIHLAKWAQSHNTYAADRLIPEGAEELASFKELHYSPQAPIPHLQPLAEPSSRQLAASTHPFNIPAPPYSGGFNA